MPLTRIPAGGVVTATTFTFNSLNVTATTVTASTITGALVISGGLGIGGSGYIGGNLTVLGTINATITGIASSATNIAGGTAGQVPYQSAAGTTSFFGPGTAGQLLLSNGASVPVYTNTASVYVGAATRAVNLFGGTAGQLSYQSAPGTTAFLSTGTTGQLLVSAAGAPVWTSTGSLYVNRAVTADSASGSAGSVANALTIGTGLSGTAGTYNGSAAVTISLNTSTLVAIAVLAQTATTATNAGTAYATIGTHSTGTGILGSSFNGSANQTWTLDTSTLMARAVQTVQSLSAGTGLTGSAFNGSTAQTWTLNTATLMSNAVTATNLAGGSANQFAYQTGAGATSFVSTGSMYVGRAVLADSVTGSAGSLVNSVTFNNAGTGDASGTSYNGGAARTVSYNTLGAMPTSGGTFSGPVTFSQPVTFSGSATYVLSTNTFYTDNILEMHTPPAGVSAPWFVDDGKDIGLRFHYYANSTDTNAALVLDNASKELHWYSAGAESAAGDFSTGTYGIFRTGAIRLVTGTQNQANTSTGALTVLGGVGVSGGMFVGGTVTATTFVGAFSGTVTGSASSVANALTIGTGLSGTAGTYNGSAAVTISLNTATLVQSATQVVQSHSAGTGLTGSAYNGSAAQTWSLNTATLMANAVSAINLSAGSAMALPYQSASGTTAYLAAGTSGQILQTNGTGSAPTWVSISGLSAGTATNADNLRTVIQTASGTYYPSFVDSNNAAAAYEAHYTTSSFVINPATGNVGLGVASPSYTLDVSSAARFASNSSSRVLYLKQNASNAGNIIQFVDQADAQVWEVVGRNNQFYIYNTFQAGYSFYINSATNAVTIAGTTSYSGEKFAVNGGAYVNGILTATTFVGAFTGASTQVQTTARSVSATYYPTFVDSNNASAATETLYTTSSFTINPGTGAVSFAGTLTQSGGYAYLGSFNADPTSAGRPVFGGSSMALSWNFSGGNAEMNLWNTVNPSTYSSTGFRFLQQLTASTQRDLVFFRQDGAVGFGGVSNVGTSGQVLQSNGAASPTWVNPSTLASASATNADNLKTIQQTASGTYYPSFVDSNNSTAAYEAHYTTSSFTINPGTGLTTIAAPIGGDGVPALRITQGTAPGTFNWASSILNSSLTAGKNLINLVGQAESGNNSAYFGFKYVGAGSASNFATIGLYGADNLLNILASGFVGIGNTAPAYKLSVNTAADVWHAQFGTSGGKQLRIGGSTTVGSVIGAYNDDSNSSPSSLLLQRDGGNVGIGTNAPRTKLEVVNGTALVNDDLSGSAASFVGSTGANQDSTVSIASNDAVAAGTGGNLSFGGRYNSANQNFANWAAIKGLKTNATSGDYGGYLSFYTRLTGAGSLERLRITGNGGFSFGASGTAYGSSGQILQSNGDAPPTWVNASGITSGATSLTNTYVGFGSASNLLTGSSSLTWNGTTLYVNGRIQTPGYKTYNVTTAGQGNVNSTYEIMRISRDSANWSTNIGYEVTVRSAYYNSGGMTKWYIVYGYDSAGAITCIDARGGTKHRVYLGAEVTVSGNIKYIPVYVDIPNYFQVAIEVKYNTTEVTTFNSSGQVYFTGTMATGTGALYGGDIHLVPNGGNIGVGTTGPTLSSGIGIHISNGSGHANLKLQSSTRAWELLGTSGGYFSIYDTTGGADRLSITTAGGIAFGGSSNYGSSGQILQSNGNAAPTWVNASTIAAGSAPLTNTYVGYGSASNTLTGSANLTFDGTILNVYGPSSNGYIRFATNTGPKLRFYDASTDKYGVEVQSSELRIYSGAQGITTGGITFGKYDGTTFTENMRVQNQGFVGIGTAAPVSKLHVAGAGNTVGGNIHLGDNTDAAAKWTYITAAHYNGATNATGVSLIGHYASSTANQINIGGNIYEAHPATEIQFYTHTATTHATGGSLRLVITRNGGISFGGASSYGSSGQILQSNGDAAPTWVSLSGLTAGTASSLLNFTAATSGNPLAADSPNTIDDIGYVASNISLYANGSAGTQTDGGLYVAGYSTSWYHQIFGDFRTGSISVRGKNSNTWQAWRSIPTIHVNDNAPSIYNVGDFWWESDTGRLKIYYHDGSSGQWVDAVPVINTSLFFSKAGGAISGPVSINGALDVTGNINATAEITAYYSDRRLKTDIVTIENALVKVKKLNGVTYRPNALAESYGLGTNSDVVGLFADEVEQVLPQAVKPAPFDIDENGNSKSGENYKTIQYEKVVPLLVEAIKEQQSIIEAQQAKIDRLMKHLGLED